MHGLINIRFIKYCLKVPRWSS